MMYAFGSRLESRTNASILRPNAGVAHSFDELLPTIKYRLFEGFQSSVLRIGMASGHSQSQEPPCSMTFVATSFRLP